MLTKRIGWEADQQCREVCDGGAYRECDEKCIQPQGNCIYARYFSGRERLRSDEESGSQCSGRSSRDQGPCNAALATIDLVQEGNLCLPRKLL